MAEIRSLDSIVKGSALMVFIGGAPVGFATSHSLSLSTNTTEINTKDNGDYPSVVVQNITWEVTAENLYSDAGKNTYLDAMKKQKTVTIQFAEISDWGSPEKGVIGDKARQQDWQPGTVILEGKALITSFSINAAAGDNATMSVTFTGAGPLVDSGE